MIVFIIENVMLDLLWLTGVLLTVANYSTCQMNMTIQEPEPTTQELVIEHILSTWKIRYALWCNWDYSCKKDQFDCSWLIDNAWRDLGIYSWRKLNSSSIFEMWKKISYKKLEKWDYLYFKRINWTWLNHIAIVNKWWNGRSVEILDLFESRRYVTPRDIKIVNGRYAWLFRVYGVRIH